jgi:hypothetical protein
MKLDKIITVLLIMLFPIFAIAETDQMQSEIDHHGFVIENFRIIFI